MSNEKLGAEQGREFDFEAIGEAIDRVLAGQRELTPAEQKNLRGIYSKLFTKLKPEQAYHARGAGLESIDGENQTHGMVVRNLTMLVRRLIHRIRSKYKALDDVVAKQAWDYLMGEGLQGSVLRGAATQRAPVEQIQSNDLDRAHGFLRGRRMPLNMDENEAIHRDLAEQFRQVRATAPDHAREGALREALELAKGALANGSTIDQRYETYKIVCEALADGKEGGE